LQFATHWSAALYCEMVVIAGAHNGFECDRTVLSVHDDHEKAALANRLNQRLGLGFATMLAPHKL